jgi:hypothetical protein
MPIRRASAESPLPDSCYSRIGAADAPGQPQQSSGPHGTPHTLDTHRPVLGAPAARRPLRRKGPATRTLGGHVADDPCQPDAQEFDRAAPPLLAATLLQLPSATSALLEHDFVNRPETLGFNIIRKLDPDRRGR